MIGATTTRRAGILAAITLAATGVLCPQPAVGQQRRSGVDIYQEQLRVQWDRQTPEAQEAAFDVGGWFSFAMFKYDDASNLRVRNLRQYQIRAWASMNLHGVHKAYVRAMYGLDDWNDGDNPIDNRNDEDAGPAFERAWYLFDLGNFLRNRGRRDVPLDMQVKVGREYATIGTALVLSMPLDMIEWQMSIRDWDFLALLGMTREDTNNIDDSLPVDDHQQRCFWGAQVTYRGVDNHRPFVYWLSQDDHTNPDPKLSYQGFDYSSRYLGAGSTGSLLPQLRYQFEIVGEFGHTFSAFQTSRRDRIRAMALDAGLTYLFDNIASEPRLGYEYLFGSGDDDRQLTSTSTIGGNRAGTEDNAFNAIGYRDTGLSFAPDVSNLNIHVLSASFIPLKNRRFFEQLELGAKVFFYHKATSGPISDASATEDSYWAGWEIDGYCNWRLTSDLTVSLRYGAFQPGSAFASQTTRHFLLTAMTLSF